MKEIHLCTAANENYAPGLLVMLASALSSTDQDTAVIIHLLNGGLSLKTINTLIKIVARFPKSRINIIPIKESVFRGFRLGPGNNHLTYARLIIGSEIQTNKIIYIDSDMLILKNLYEVWNYDMNGKTALACRDKGIPIIMNDCPWTLPPQEEELPYFNAGFMVIDLNNWRLKNIESSSLNLAANTDCRCWDQTILNYLLKHDVFFINEEWNMQERVNVGRDVSNTKNYHFTSPFKPWNYYYSDYPYMLWRKYYSEFIGSITVNLISKKKFRSLIVWYKDYLIQNYVFIKNIYFKIKGISKHLIHSL
jgi:lipopolysaccharide biosynthesis glycosyltransferase